MKPEVAELKAWMASESDDFRELVWRILASLPGGDEAEELGYEPLGIGWKELDLLGKLCNVLQDASDVRQTISDLLSEDED